jgi:acetyl-CoA carboxylase biotin carboxyl carrier protein
VELTDDDVREILRIIDATPLRELRIETHGFKLHVVRDGGAAAADEQAREHAGEPAGESAAAGAVNHSARGVPITSPADGLLTIEAPMLGTFYRAEAPGEPPFVEVGSRVEPDTTVCIIEVMKMMNSVPAGVAGTVVEVCSENGVLVEYGAALFRVEPA